MKKFTLLSIMSFLAVLYAGVLVYAETAPQMKGGLRSGGNQPVFRKNYLKPSYSEDASSTALKASQALQYGRPAAPAQRAQRIDGISQSAVAQIPSDTAYTGVTSTPPVYQPPRDSTGAGLSGVSPADSGRANTSGTPKTSTGSVSTRSDLITDLGKKYGNDAVIKMFLSLGATASRFDLDTLASVMRNRLDNLDDGRPLAVVISPQEDYNGAFKNSGMGIDYEIDQLNANGYRTMVYNVDSETKMVSALQDATRNGTCRASVLIIAGHGAPTELHFGKKIENPGNANLSFLEPIVENDDNALSVSDGWRMEQSGIKGLLNDDATIILHSCSTGSGFNLADNLANAVSRLFPESKIFSSSEKTFGTSLQFGSDGAIKDVNFYIRENPNDPSSPIILYDGYRINGVLPGGAQLFTSSEDSRFYVDSAGNGYMVMNGGSVFQTRSASDSSINPSDMSTWKFLGADFWS